MLNAHRQQCVCGGEEFTQDPGHVSHGAQNEAVKHETLHPVSDCSNQFSLSSSEPEARVGIAQWSDPRRPGV